MKIKTYKICAYVSDEYTTRLFRETVKGIGSALRSLGELKMMGADEIEIIDIEEDEIFTKWECEIEPINL